MLTDTRGEFPHQSLRPCWPKELFDTRRKFDRKAENIPYIDWLRSKFENPDGTNEQEEEEEEEDDDDSGAQVEDQRDEDDDENKAEIGADDKTVDPFKGRSVVRFFMEGMDGDERLLEYRDQVDVVVNFGEQSRFGESEKRVALLDDRTNGGASPMKGKYCRQYRGPLTLQQLREVLSEERFKVKSDLNDSANTCREEACDLERRILCIPDLEPSTMEALAVTAPRSHARALKNFFYKYLTGKASIGATIPSQGFKVFTFDFHIPYYVLKESPKLLEDSRTRIDGKPLRKSWALPFLSGPMSASLSAKGVQSLYEAQISVTLTGIDCWVWTAYGSFDTYFGSKESLEAYNQMVSFIGRPDPLAAGQLATNNPIWTPKEYFFKVLEIRMHEVRREWNAIVDRVDDDVKQKDDSFPLISIDSSTRQEVRDFSTWSTEMVKLLRRLINNLSETVGAWDKFKRKGVWLFLCDSESANTPSSLKPTIGAAEEIFEDLRSLLEKLRDLAKDLCQDSPQGLNAHYNQGNHEAQIFQQKSAFHIQVLTVITILFLPPALAAAIFSTQGVLPFTPNLARFTYVLFILGILVVVSIVALYKWHSWIQLIVECISWRPRKIGLPKQFDLEMGRKKGLNDGE